MTKKEYTAVELEILTVGSIDVITTSDWALPEIDFPLPSGLSGSDWVW